ncbi:MAG: iron donor protein CyaY [Terriglobia bacterium]
MPLDEQQFRDAADQALTKLQRDLERASDNHDFDVESNQGALSIEFENPPAKFVVSPNSPVRQIWVSARVKSFKLDWDEARQTFVLGSDGRSLHQLIGDVITEQTGESVSL